MAVILITGMSGTGKSAALAELARRGHRVVDTDYGDWIEDVPLPDGSVEPLWNEERIDALLREHTDGALFIVGTVANQGRFYPRFDAVVLLSAPLDVILERVATRESNPFGKTATEREKIADDLAGVRAAATGRGDGRDRHATTARRGRGRARVAGSSDGDVACAERRRQRLVRGARADESRTRRIDAVCPRERERQPRKRRAAPADGRAASVDAHGDLGRPRDRRRGLDRARSVRAPVEDQMWCGGIGVFRPAGRGQSRSRYEDS